MNIKNFNCITLVSFLLLISSIGCAHPLYSRGPWAGKVIDAETKEPIEGAAVVAVWKESYAALPGGGTAFVDATETLTDKEGDFKIEAKSFIAMRPEGKIYGPLFTIFKPSFKIFKYTDMGLLNDPRDYYYYPKEWKDLFEKPDAVVELSKWKTRDERMRMPDSVDDVDSLHEYKIKEFIRLRNSELIELGLKPY